MLDTTADTWYTWLGLVAASLAVAGVVTGLPTAHSPTAAHIARTVDDVATSPYEERERVAVSAQKLRLGPDRVAVRNGGGTAHATFTAKVVVPVREGPLEAVLEGQSPAAVFESKAQFRRRLQASRTSDPRWRDAPDKLTVRHTSWGAIDATLVG